MKESRITAVLRDEDGVHHVDVSVDVSDNHHYLDLMYEILKCWHDQHHGEKAEG